MVIVVNDDAVYLSWIRRHHGGYVVDTKRKAMKRNTTLHLATCDAIRTSRTKRTHWTTGDHIKACSMDRAELLEWFGEQIGGEPRLCDACLPIPKQGSSLGSTRFDTDDHHLTKLGRDIVSVVLESAVIHLDNDLEYWTTIDDIASQLSKTPAQIGPAVERLVAQQMVEIEGEGERNDANWSRRRIFPTGNALATIPAFGEMNSTDLQSELSMLHRQADEGK
ncbi:MAG: hypothetical protein H8E66_27855 [Planctomycetes bacterium]|nr:hypothetical protein [Planctomycetota bacterium]